MLTDEWVWNFMQHANVTLKLLLFFDNIFFISNKRLKIVIEFQVEKIVTWT